MKYKYTIQDITEIGIFVGLALVLNLHIFSIRISGGEGSISFTMIPLYLIALRKSWWKSFISCGIIYGLIACLMDTPKFGFATYPLDYLLAYGSICFVSLFRGHIFNNNKRGILFLIFSVAVTGLLRYIFASIDGMIFYTNYQLIPSLISNALYVLPTCAVSLGILILLFVPLKRINERYPSEKEI